MSDMRLAVIGASGRMGQMMIRTIAETPGVILTGALHRSNSSFIGQDAGELAGCRHLGIATSGSPEEVLANADGIIDFSTPTLTVEIAKLAAQGGIAHVIGTTGMSQDDLMRIKSSACNTVVVRSGNMSVGVNLLAAICEKISRALDPEWDIEIVEMHHRLKKDAPSGTALLLGEAAARGRKKSLSDCMVNNQHVPRRDGEIGFAVLRGGNVIGDHTVIFANTNERIEITHRAQSRELFCHGAIKAALWARHQKPGLYSMADVFITE
jgi:4-hydroxy-tetrahydrodipicolinate reductase